MLPKLKPKVVPLALLVLSSAWVALVFGPLIFFLLSPTRDIQQVVGGLEGRIGVPEGLGSLQRTVFGSVGCLRRAIPVSAYYGGSIEYEHDDLRKSRTTQVSYLAWFERRPNPTILIITRTEVEGSPVRFDVNEARPLTLLRLRSTSIAALAFSLYFYRRRGRFLGRHDEPIAPV